MIGIFDSGLGGLTVLRALVARFPHIHFVYLGDHANVPYGDRDSDEVVELSRRSVEALFKSGCKLVVLGCNTATAVAARRLQQAWLPESSWRGHNVLGIVAPTVEAATQTPWAVDSPQYPQKYNTDLIAVFGTTRTITSGVYPEEISKRGSQWAARSKGCLAEGPLLIKIIHGSVQRRSRRHWLRAARSANHPAEARTAKLARSPVSSSFTVFKRIALAMTLTEDSDIAAAAMMGDRRMPKNG
jgi:glutamate racemase